MLCVIRGMVKETTEDFLDWHAKVKETFNNFKE